MKTLYLGLDPKNYPCKGDLTHYPVIRTERFDCADLQSAEKLWPEFTHVVFTSQTAVHYWDCDLKGKICIAIGDVTADAVRRKGAVPFIAPKPTQEGVIEFLSRIDLQGAFLFLPRSRL